MSNVQLFDFRTAKVRVVMIEGNPWFVARDVLEVLGLKLTTSTGSPIAATAYLHYLGQDEVKKLTKTEAVTDKDFINHLFTGRSHISTLISESGLYKLLMRSNKPEAKVFQDWVTKEVLPAIRKDGGYILGEENEALKKSSGAKGGALTFFHSSVFSYLLPSALEFYRLRYSLDDHGRLFFSDDHSQ